MDPCTGTMLLQLSSVRPFKERTMTLSDDDRCHLHQHLCADDWQHYHNSPVVQHYRKVCRLFRREVDAPIERFSEMRLHIGSFDAFCERVAGMRCCHHRVRFPTKHPLATVSGRQTWRRMATSQGRTTAWS